MISGGEPLGPKSASLRRGHCAPRNGGRDRLRASGLAMSTTTSSTAGTASHSSARPWPGRRLAGGFARSCPLLTAFTSREMQASRGVEVSSREVWATSLHGSICTSSDLADSSISSSSALPRHTTARIPKSQPSKAQTKKAILTFPWVIPHDQGASHARFDGGRLETGRGPHDLRAVGRPAEIARGPCTAPAAYPTAKSTVKSGGSDS